MPAMSTPPQGPPPGWKPQHGVWPGYQPPPSPAQQPGPHPTEWWHDNHKWRPPVGNGPTRMQLAGQVPGMLIKLIFLVGLLVLCVVGVGAALFH